MKRKFLEDLGLQKEQIDQILDANSQDIGKAKGDLERTQTDLAAARQEVSDLKVQIETLEKSSGDFEAMKTQIASLEADNRAKDEVHTSAMNQLKIDFAVEKALAGANAKNVDVVRAMLNLADVNLDEQGNAVGLQEQLDKLVADEKTKFLFNGQEPQTFRGFQPGTSTSVPNSTQAGYEARLADARKMGNQLEVIKIKQEAANDGVILT